MPYVFWDWNGTLLDDTQAALDALNELLRARGEAPIDMDFYRANFAFPVRPFYDRIHLHVSDAEWDGIAREYHALYARQSVALNRETIAALEAVRAAGAGQSIISALRQDLLNEATASFGVAPYMEFVYGTDNLDGASKLVRAHELLSSVRARHAGTELRPVLIGDALHDKEVADALGIRCVLCAQGGHSRERLERVAPTGGTLLEAVALALEISP